jgi:sortase A
MKQGVSVRLKTHLQRVFLLVGTALLAFYGTAKLHEFILSRAAIRQFENLRETTLNSDVKKKAEPQLVALRPSFLLWSEKRIRDYEESLSASFALPLAIIRIDRVHVEAPIFEGTDDMTLNRGAGHIADTALFGEEGNVGIAGHRDGFFRGLKDVKIGDHIDIEEPGRVETYVVGRLEIVSPANVSVLRPSGGSALTLVTCYPFYYIGSAPQRFIVHATLTGSRTTAPESGTPTERRY